MSATEFIDKAKIIVKDHALAIGAATATVAIAAFYIFIVKPRKTCPNCQGWNTTIDEKCMYCGRVL